MASAFDVPRFEELLSSRTFGRNLIFESSVGSTMDLARDAAMHGAPHGTLALADEQTAGRGRLGRSWVTPPAVNLASTLLLRPPSRLLRQVAMIAPLAVCDAAQEVASIECDIKWPNDVQVHGKKLAGVLIESDLTDPASPLVLVGVGINVNFDPTQHDEISAIATSMRVEAGTSVDREAVLAAYVTSFECLYMGAERGTGTNERWRARLVTVGQRVHAAWPGGSAEGTAVGVTEDGALVIETQDGARVIVEAGDVTLRG